MRVEKSRVQREEEYELWTTWLMAMSEGRGLDGVVKGEELSLSIEDSEGHEAYGARVRKA